MDTNFNGLFIIAVAAVLYFLPAICAARRQHNDVGAIVALNILLGWTVLGWIASFCWSLTGNVKRAESIQN